MSVDRFISGDWGTSRLRLRLVRQEPFEILETVESDDGIAAVYDQWKDGSLSREKHFEAVLREQIGKFGESIESLPMILSGMASSAIGWRELPYAPLPHRLSDPLPAEMVGAELDVRLISGLRFDSRDVMRGEETQVMGLWGNPSLGLPSRFRVLLPGTHSKHVVVENDTITEFQTFLTGDLFQALGKHTILKHSLDLEKPIKVDDSFREGVARIRDEPLDGALFGIRCADLFNERQPAGNASYLSGMLIGSEMKSMSKTSEPVVVAATPLGELYAEAVRVMGVGTRLLVVPEVALDEAVPRAHARLFGSSSQGYSQSLD